MEDDFCIVSEAECKIKDEMYEFRALQSEYVLNEFRLILFLYSHQFTLETFHLGRRCTTLLPCNEIIIRRKKKATAA